MGDSRYKRVSRARPYLICGKPDWCSRTSDDTISFCAHVTTGADRLSRKEQWGIFYHDRELFKKSFTQKSEPRNFYKCTNNEIISAPLEIRDFAYTSLIGLSPASNYQSLMKNKKGLLEQGLLERGLETLEDYGGLPCSASDRRDLAAQIRLLLNQNFPDFIRQNPHGIRHIPGFWLDDSGAVNLWQNCNFETPLLLIPYRNPVGKIQAFQIRFPGALAANKKHYLWLSLPNLNSARSGTPLHYAGWKSFGCENNSAKPILVTEGAFKADVVAKLRPDFFAIANGGVNCSQDLIVKVSCSKKLYVAFDRDYQENPAVARGFARLLKLQLNQTSDDQSFAATKVIVWESLQKGIDDALLNGERLKDVSPSEWYSSLPVKCREAVQQVWTELFDQPG
jgi:hypothetical protein